ncbi:MAG: flavodoxin family protein [Culicoidibacterales bacterium]
MKTLIFVGSPKKRGHTMALVNKVMETLSGEIEVINVFNHLDISPCTDCGYCTKKSGCSIDDDFNQILEKIAAADAYIIATPMWFGSISGPLLSFFSRLQTISCGLIFRKDVFHKWDKAAILLATSGASWHSMMKPVETTAEFMFSHLDAMTLDFVYATQTDVVPAKENPQAMKRCELAAQKLNQWYEDKSKGGFYQYGYSSVNYLRAEQIKGE